MRGLTVTLTVLTLVLALEEAALAQTPDVLHVLFLGNANG